MSEAAGTLILCASPIGNLSDAAPRLAEALGSADVIYAEDTRRSHRLLDALGIDVRARSYFVGNEEARSQELARRLESGATVALLTDAGTPGVADPGVSAVRAARAVGASITVIPGPSAVTAALAVSGLSADRFVFEGFLPKKGRADVLEAMAGEVRTTVIFLTPSRIGHDLADLAAALGAHRRVVVTRELTKLHEEVWYGTLEEAAQRWAEGGRGEFTVVIEGAQPAAPSLEDAVSVVEALIREGASTGDAVKRVARLSGVKRRDLYEAVHRE